MQACQIACPIYTLAAPKQASISADIAHAAWSSMADSRSAPTVGGTRPHSLPLDEAAHATRVGCIALVHVAQPWASRTACSSAPPWQSRRTWGNGSAASTARAPTAGPARRRKEAKRCEHPAGAGAHVLYNASVAVGD